MIQWGSLGMSESQRLSPVKLEWWQVLRESKEGSRRICESEEKAGSLVSAVSSWGRRPGGGVWLVPVVWPQGWEEMALPTCYYSSWGWAQPDSWGLAAYTGSTAGTGSTFPSSGFQDTPWQTHSSSLTILDSFTFFLTRLSVNIVPSSLWLEICFLKMLLCSISYMQSNTKILSAWSDLTNEHSHGSQTLIKTQNISIPPETSSFPLPSQYSCTQTHSAWSNQPRGWLPSPHVEAAILELHTNGIPHILFCVWLPSLNMLLKFMQVVACISS